VFHLVSAEVSAGESLPIPTGTLDELRRMAYNASRDVAERSTREAFQAYYKRSAAVKAYVLARARGTCEACHHPGPFRRHDGSRYLEPHHTRRVSDGGPDDPRWVGGICPNCHREIHHGATGKELNEKLELYLHGIE
jgi:5-methylcytosine-specific restriction enzyme A